MNENKSTGYAPVGSASLMVIFSVLCLTVFALLALSTVQANRALGDGSAAAVLEYYRADCAAEETLARLRAGEIPPGTEKRNNVYFYTHPISDTQILAVEVWVDGSDYEIYSWQVVSVMDWQANNDLPVWNETTGEEPG